MDVQVAERLDRVCQRVRGALGSCVCCGDGMSGGNAVGYDVAPSAATVMVGLRDVRVDVGLQLIQHVLNLCQIGRFGWARRPRRSFRDGVRGRVDVRVGAMRRDPYRQRSRQRLARRKVSSIGGGNQVVGFVLVVCHLAGRAQCLNDFVDRIDGAGHTIAW